MVRNVVPKKTVSVDWRDERVIVAEDEFDSVVSKAMNLITAMQGTDKAITSAKKEEVLKGMDNLFSYELNRSKLVESRLNETDKKLEVKSEELVRKLKEAKESLEECKNEIKRQDEERKSNKVPDMMKKLGERARLEDWDKRIEKAVADRDTIKASAASAKAQSEELRLTIHHFLHKLAHLTQTTENLVCILFILIIVSDLYHHETSQ